MTDKTTRAGWLDPRELAGHKCEYGIPVQDEAGCATGAHHPCGKPAVYKSVAGGGYFCAEHGKEVAEHDERVYRPQ